MSQILVARFERVTQGSAREAAEQAHRRLGRFEKIAGDVAEVPAVTPQLAVRAQKPVSRGQ
ncbi:hypothetical protein [Streptomyces sp. NPDC090798]|uniref:hypothetical protein n=1 Tax=Streptomyces sp. NPDC090798 TaxID=3365968 RepID=UPI0038282286